MRWSADGFRWLQTPSDSPRWLQKSKPKGNLTKTSFLELEPKKTLVKQLFLKVKQNKKNLETNMFAAKPKKT